MSYAIDRLQEIKSGPPVVVYKNIERETTRHGRTVFYYRVGKGKRIRLPDRDRVDEDAFRKAYQDAASGRVSHVARGARATVPNNTSPIGSPGYVYFAKSGDQVKIGFTTNIKARISTIQTSSAVPIKVLTVIPGSSGTEKYFHDRFRDYRVGGEWFTLTGILAEFLGVKPTKY